MAVQIEDHRKNVNDAKMRAVAQRVPTYDDFHQMVLGADLKPMAKKDRGKVSLIEGLTSEKRGQFFGNDLYTQATPELGAANGVTDRAAADGAVGELFEAPKDPPANAMVFTREWRRCSGSRSHYLSALPAEIDWWSSCFKVGIDVTILTQVVASWEELSRGRGVAGQGASVAGDPEPVPEHGGAMPAAGVLRAAACCLVGLGKTERYSITLNLLNDQEAATLRGLCEVVCAALASDGAPDATELRSALCEGATYAAYLAPAAGENDAALSAME